MSKPKRMPALSRIEIERDRSGFYVLTTVRRGLIETWWAEPGALRRLHRTLDPILGGAIPLSLSRVYKLDRATPTASPKR
jgi:hypothetical protein